MNTCDRCDSPNGPFYSRNAGPFLCPTCATDVEDDSKCPDCGHTSYACSCDE
jgi:hypothetical protein